MKGLLLKDLYVLMRQMKIFLVMIVIFALVPGGSMTVFAVVYAGMMPYTALAYDERCKWDVLAGMMPYTKRQIVLSKYVLGYLFVLGTAVFSLLAKVVTQHFTSQPADVASVLLAFCAGFIMLAVTLPPMFRFGVEKGRLFFILLMVVVACGSAGLVQGVMQTPDLQPYMPLLSAALPAAALVLNLISVPLSVRLYRGGEN